LYGVDPRAIALGQSNERVYEKTIHTQNERRQKKIITVSQGAEGAGAGQRRKHQEEGESGQTHIFLFRGPKGICQDRTPTFGH
jgi:hypothetical protein